MPTNQGNLFDQEPPSQEVEVTTEQISYERKKPSTHKRRNKLPSHLPVEEVIIEPDVDTTGMVKIGEEVTETLDYTPASLCIIRTPTHQICYQEGRRRAANHNRSITRESHQ